MFIAILGILGSIAYIVTSTDLKIASNYKTSIQAFYSAEAGLEEARERLRLLPSDSNNIRDPNASYDPMWSAYILTSSSWQTTNDPHYNSSMTNYIPHSSSNTSNAIVANSLQSSMPYFVKVRHKREFDAEQVGHTVSSAHYYDGDGSTSTHSAASPGNIVYYGYGNPGNPTAATQFTTSGATQFKPVTLVTAYGNTNNSMCIIETEIVYYPGPPIPAPLYAKGNVTGNGTAITVDGNDFCSTGSPLPPVYTKSPATTTLSGLPTMLGTPANPIAGTWDIPITDYINQLKGTAKITITADENGATYGSATNYTVCYSDTSNPLNINGLTFQNVTGYGLLLVDGDLTLGGNVDWNGVILVTGVLTLNGGGGINDINIKGAVLAEQTVPLNGNIDIVYDTCKINSSLYSQTRKVVSWRRIY
jgi:hypothetical protein